MQARSAPGAARRPPGLAAGARSFDVVVLGGGMAGLTAALSAAESGASVSVLESDDVPGGAARYSSGRIWTLADYPAMRRVIPLGDAVLQRALIDAIEPACAWLGATVGNLVPQPAAKSGKGYMMTLGTTGDRSAYFQSFAARLAAAGARLQFGTRATVAETARDGAFLIGAESGGGRASFTAKTLVIATGGYQGSGALLEKYIGAESRALMLRSTTHATGAGHAIGWMLGGAKSRGTGGFYGKSMPLHAERAAPSDYKHLTLDFTRFSIAVNREGRRFVDESAGMAGEAIPNAGILQPGGRYFLVCNSSQIESAQREAFLRLAVDAGAPPREIVLEAESTEALAGLMQEHWGAAAEALNETFAEMNAHTSGEAPRLVPPRHVAPAGLNAPPFVAIACQPAITIPFGGLRVDADMALVGEDDASITNVFVCGADAGGVYCGTYGGGLAWALASGCIAGRSASAAARWTMRSIA